MRFLNRNKVEPLGASSTPFGVQFGEGSLLQDPSTPNWSRFCGQVFAAASRRGVAFRVAVHANVDAWERCSYGVGIDATPRNRARIQPP